MTKHSHYHKDVEHLKTIDVYRTLELFGVTDQALGHAIKKLLCAGQRGAGKTFEQDVREAVDTLNRRLQMLAEDDNQRAPVKSGSFSDGRGAPPCATHWDPALRNWIAQDSEGGYSEFRDYTWFPVPAVRLATTWAEGLQPILR